MRVLVVDDNADTVLVLGMLLAHLGHEVEAAVDGEAALAKFEEFQPEIVILDIGLPDMDGHEVARAIRANSGGSGCKLIALTGYGQARDQELAREAGFDLHLVKPVGLEDLRRAIEPPSPGG